VLLHATLGTRFSDAQCGFKAIRREAAQQLLPHVRDGGWFFDTELLVLAQRTGLRIHEVPVDWIDDPDSRVDLVATARADLRGIARMWRTFLTGAVPVRQLRARLGGPVNREPRRGAGVRRCGGVRRAGEPWTGCRTTPSSTSAAAAEDR